MGHYLLHRVGHNSHRNLVGVSIAQSVACIAGFCKTESIFLRWSYDTTTASTNRILCLCAERNITINKLATMCALPPSSVKNILYGRSVDPKILTIKKICDGLDITLAEFFSTPEFDALEQEIK